MKWKGNRQSSNVEDRRGQRGPRMGGRGINPLLIGPLLRLLFSKTGLIIVGILLLLGLVTGVNPLSFITGGASPVSGQTSGPYKETAEEAEMAAFSRTILANTEDVWNNLTTITGNPPWCFTVGLSLGLWQGFQRHGAFLLPRG